MDIDTIKPGQDFVQVLEKTVGDCDVLIVLVGRHWLDVIGEQGQRRLDLKEDFLRREIEIGLDRNICVIPVLVQGAVMPRPGELPQAISPLARRHAFQLPDVGFHRAVDELIAAVESVSADVQAVGPKSVGPKNPRKRTTLRAYSRELHLPLSKFRRMFLLYKPPKVYGWLFRYWFMGSVFWCVFMAPLLALTIAGLPDEPSAAVFLGSVPAVALFALGVRSLTVRLERKFVAKEP